ncbi:MAG: restriction endonuclease [Aureliella sp.]
MDRRNPTFEEVRKLSRNGKERVRVLICASSVECRARTHGTRAQIDFDLHSCNYDLRPEAGEQLWQEYNEYRERTRFKTRMHPHFSRTSIWFDVHREDAEVWFQRVLRALQEPSVITLCDAAIEFADYMKREAEELLLGMLIEVERDVPEGTMVRMIAPAWLEVVRLIQANPRILESMEPRKFEELVAGAYKRAGFESVILTPRSGDHGVDVIAERHGIGKVRIVDQAKRYKPGTIVTADDVRALGFVALADGKSTKGIITTTSSFAPKLALDRYLGPKLKSGRIELIDGTALLDRLVRLMHGYAS